ncbi:flavodoxin [Clostridium tetanomorphum]|nr:flavodoxin [Clostridium tetanomorphum]
MKSYGAELVDDGLIINETPDEEGIEKCKELGKDLAKA